ncbi:MAG: prolyl oligopeptidase family serine peptidase [Candidatus Pacebacteria bacterium]|jgi:uncharacterized protein|nr:prolyl oligopeptidase family serine peptidase [Candidatus Paceibacterota bacterium]MBT3512178.1 prolyl oligopeptidase family serine peptidase [Candidatus Paceibacterota bacterium]MBT4004905.1 prolyl oligopeptidase family serine peptidase [Candidatus Paceibacterota bacterium]MBT4358653.1 prolyl oligopeptidase family serine peptidase [Candidatus Paceibacterota bacterium]MBT4681352.1 prolyl oligopeptidase family serine peptidase [Candidatus Paceibacterota bacterium]
MQFTIKKISIPVENQTMDGTLYTPDINKDKFPAVVVYHGRGSSQARYTDRAEELVKSGFITLIFSFRGCGDSDGEFKDQTLEMGYQDALAAYDFLFKQDNVDKNRIGVYGGSYGGYQATLVSKEREFESLVLSVPALYKNEWWKIVPESLGEETTQKYRDGDDFADNKAIKAIEGYAGQLLLIQHELDDICPKKQTDSFFNYATLASKKEKIMMNRVGHPLMKKEDRDKSNKMTVDWFKETL